MQQGWHVTVLPFIMILTEKGRESTLGFWTQMTSATTNNNMNSDSRV